ncbi:MAG: hypothetical protein LQ337_007989 [Flavoplaca oasis]|nr:MAG: hypothetical protein LQ337_007989 [Flavoplaca oasis]
MSLPKTKRNAHPGFGPDIPAAFHSLEEARNCLDYQWNLCARSDLDFRYRNHLMEGTETQEHRDAFDVNRVHFQAVYNTWMTVFQKFLERNVATMNSKSLQGAMVLKMQGQLAAMYQELDTFQLLHDETGWDEVIPRFDNLVDLVAAIIDSQKATDEKLLHKPIFQLDQSTISPLFTVGYKCRDPILRRKAISMLYSAPRQEGVWDSILTARACERIMNLEEEGLGEVKYAADIPDWRRISDIEVSFDLQARRGEIKMSRRRCRHSNVRQPITEVFEW